MSEIRGYRAAVRVWLIVMMSQDACYRALLACDPRMDGLFFVGVSTTGIYCRPICPARKPRRASCSFYPSAAAAEAAGFRPCLRCRPELAPSMSPYDDRLSTAAGIIARIQSGCLNNSGSVDDLAHAFAMSVRQLRRIVRDVTGASPIALAQTTRLLLAKQLLTETRLPITRVAYASGFSSLRRFNELFLAQYRLSPRRFREENATTTNGRAALDLRLACRPPLAWDSLLEFLRPRAIPGVEHVTNVAYARTVVLGEVTGTIRVRRSRSGDQLMVSASVSLAPVLQPLLSCIRDQFDMHARPDVIESHLESDRHLAHSIRANRGLRVPGAFDGFELAWRAILGQQVSVAGATTIAGRFAARFAEPIDTGIDHLTMLTPTARTIAAKTPDQLASVGIPVARARTIIAIARFCMRNPDMLRPGTPADEVRARLLELPGIGPWTAEYITMRALHWPDAFPDTDLGLRKAAERLNVEDLKTTSQSWRPWRAYAAMHLWSLLGDET